MRQEKPFLRCNARLLMQGYPLFPGAREKRLNRPIGIDDPENLLGTIHGHLSRLNGS